MKRKFIIFVYKCMQTESKKQERTFELESYSDVTFAEKQRGKNSKNMKNFHPSGTCPVRDVLCRLGDKWSMLVLLTLQTNGVMRFSEIQRSVGDISHRMLAVTLRTLEADGIVSRRVYAEVPPRVEYNLTPRGASLMPHIQGLVGWAQVNMTGILAGRAADTAATDALSE